MTGRAESMRRPSAWKEHPIVQLKKIEAGKYDIVADGANIGTVQREVFGWRASRSFPTLEQCHAFVATGQRFEFIRKTRQEAIWAFFARAK